jgi:hypothetical protein
MLMAKRAAKKVGKPYRGLTEAVFAPVKKRKAAGKKSAVKKSMTYKAKLS